MDPAEVMERIDGRVRALDTASKELGKAITAAAEAELAYEEAFEKALLEVRDGYRERGERLPAEELRRAEAHRKLERRLYADWIVAKARVDALRAYVRAIEAEASGLQSVLRALTEEAKAAA